MASVIYRYTFWCVVCLPRHKLEDTLCSSLVWAQDNMDKWEISPDVLFSQRYFIFRSESQQVAMDSTIKTSLCRTAASEIRRGLTIAEKLT